MNARKHPPPPLPPELAERLTALEPDIRRVASRLSAASRMYTPVDLYYEGVLAIQEKWESFDKTKGSFEKWALAVVRNKTKDVLRQESRKASVRNESTDVALDSLPGTAFPRPDESYIRKSMESAVKEGLKRLPRPYAVVLRMYYVDGLTMKEIAALLKLHESRVSQIRTSALLRLRDFLSIRGWM
ncbi:MAG: sigma-70 family RNA polymerase sigma factor [Bryobacterales bacterium]|nr:sigma-70 family RNA polymerase sigma factor [Bryobacterales bacterium]